MARLPGEYFDCAWLSENPVAGLIPAGGNQVVDVYVDATGLTPGTYNCDLIISSNDPSSPSVIVPVTLNVIEYPDINVTPTTLTFVVPEGGSNTQSITIGNTAVAGFDNLNWSIFEQNVVLRNSDGSEIPIHLKMSNNSNELIKVDNDENEMASSIFPTGSIGASQFEISKSTQKMNYTESMTEGLEKYNDLDLAGYI